MLRNCFQNIPLVRCKEVLLSPTSATVALCGGSSGDSHLLQMLQNCAARIATNSSYDGPVANWIKELTHIADSPRYDQTRDRLHLFSNPWEVSRPLTSLLCSREAGPKTLWIWEIINSKTDLLAPWMKTSSGQKACFFRGSKVWDELEHEVKLAHSLSTVKR